jgi:hypothetical protein
MIRRRAFDTEHGRGFRAGSIPRPVALDIDALRRCIERVRHELGGAARNGR